MNKDYELNDINHEIYYSEHELSNAVIEINDTCNFLCDHCYLGIKENKHMKLELFKKIIDELYDIGCLSILLTGGEPFLNPDFKEMYLYAKKSGFLVSINSNGSIMDNELLEVLKKYKPYAIEISMYGYDEKSYLDFTHNNAYRTVMNNISKLKNNDINVKLKTVVTKNNYKYLNKIVKIANQMELSFRYDYIVFPKIMGNDKKNNEVLKPTEIIKIIKKDKQSKSYFNNKIIKLTTADNNHIFQCLGGEQSIYIDTDGNINMCVALVNNQYNINNISIKETITKFKDFKRKLLYNKNDKCNSCNKKSICRYCPARFKLETGKYNKCPSWYCNLADLIIDEYDTFQYDLNDFILKEMFKILSCNMSKLYKTTITDKDYKIWIESVLNNKNLKTIINYDGKLNGYLQYMDFNNEGKICICEVEIESNHQGDGKTFKKLMTEFLKRHSGKKYDNYLVYGNINHNNIHSKDVVTHLGFKTVDGKSYTIEIAKLRSKYL